ncbi:E3 ubiquitin-protein ligase TRIM50 [Aphelenchoides fujianensis]|nr:E3 ubiquitin-protein ligase TRIM50 [Aphelenchoides fujianensis]
MSACGCTVCFLPFDLDTRLPKLLPCGHNFCSDCLFALYLHQEFYLLDTVRCPKCRSTFVGTSAMTAPTNYELCNQLEALETSGQNVTVIHVPARAETPKRRRQERKKRTISFSSVSPSSTSGVGSSMSTTAESTGRNPRTLSSGSPSAASAEGAAIVEERPPADFCFDCRRFVGPPDRAVVARFCETCYGTAKRIRLVCLECCVNRHNGHQLVGLEKVEAEQRRFERDLREVGDQQQKFAASFADRLARLGGAEASPAIGDLCGMKRAFDLINNELLSTIQKYTIRCQLEHHQLHPREIRVLRQKPFILLARMQRLSNMLQNLCEASPTGPKRLQSTSFLSKSNPNLSAAPTDRPVGGSLASLDSAVESMCTLAALMPETQGFEDIRQFLVILCSTETSLHVRVDVLRSCVRGLNDLLDSRTAPEFLLLFNEAFLHCFLALNRLVPRRSAQARERPELWKSVQEAYGELLQTAGMHWPSTNGNRVQLVADWSRLCAAFGDVCDSATVTLCTVEAERAKTAVEETSGQPVPERAYVISMLKQIEENLCECRREQKLAQICVRSRRKQRTRPKRWWWSCFSPKVQ